MDRQSTQQQLDELAEPLRKALDGEAADVQRHAALLRDWLSYAKRFRGNRSDYYSPDNLLLPRVVTTRLGVPLTLCLVYLLVGRRLNAPVYVLDLPHHQVIRYGEEPNVVFIDPYHDGALMSEAECRATVQRIGAPLPETAFLPLNDYQVMERLLRALAAVFTQRRETKAQQQMERYRQIWRGNGPAL
jgi:regulator of sirC expression with transglutaminase-like and TPR domain